MKIELFTEQPYEYIEIEQLIKDTFASEEFSDKQEHNLVARLRKGESFIPELSIVAKLDNQLVGHILFTRAFIVNSKARLETLALAPLVVSKSLQKQGVGSLLIQRGLDKARELGYKSVIALGHPEYYQKFGFIEANKFEISAPFEIESKYFMALELVSSGLYGVSGVVAYAEEFGG